MGFESFDEFRRKHSPTVERLYNTSRAARWALPKPDFGLALYTSAGSYFRRGPKASAWNVEGYLNKLHVEDLALASACHLGIEQAWLYFLNRYRPILQSSARALVREEAAALELADSAYGELYGLKKVEGRRLSLLEYFHGRSSLATWLRAVVARLFVDSQREAKRSRLVSDEEAVLSAPNPGGSDPPEPDLFRHLMLFRDALVASIARLAPRDRLRLSYYYLQGLSLAQVGKLLGEHESTASRKVQQTRETLRRSVEQTLRNDRKMSEAQVRACYDSAVEEWPFDLTAVLTETAGK
ncbi:MAG: polymerase sigma-70 factor, subfamily [Candidatus Binatota bacterium]|nr:polymerase sigma-70 factor, subfamily [Candidatus Binatota bacterium]